MSVNSNMYSDLLGLYTVHSLARIKTHGYNATACVCLPAEFSGIIAGLNSMADLKGQHNLKRSQETCLFHYKQCITTLSERSLIAKYTR